MKSISWRLKKRVLKRSTDLCRGGDSGTHPKYFAKVYGFMRFFNVVIIKVTTTYTFKEPKSLLNSGFSGFQVYRFMIRTTYLCESRSTDLCSSLRIYDRSTDLCIEKVYGFMLTFTLSKKNNLKMKTGEARK